MSEDGRLLDIQWDNQKGCGGGTDNECYALGNAGLQRMFCLWGKSPQLAEAAETLLKGRVNTVESGCTYCPLGILPNSIVDPSTIG